MVNLAKVFLPLNESIANILKHFQNILGYIPLKQAWAYQSQIFTKISFFWDNKTS